MSDDSVYFEKIKNKKIFCFLSEPIPTQKKIVIMSHGFRGSSIGPARAFVDFSKLLVSHGFSALRFDQPNSGNSAGDYIHSSFNEWVETIVYFAQKFLNGGYKIALLGQSMGTTAAVVATSRKELHSKIQCLILWVPDPVTSFNKPVNKIYEEEGQRYKGTFWQEAKDADFFRCVRDYKGGIHLVYGEYDRYVSREEREIVIKEVKQRDQPLLILKGQDHSCWKYELAQKAYQGGLKILQKYL